MDETLKIFNINNFVWVNLTVLGIATWREDFEKYAPKDYAFEVHYAKYTKDDWTQFQLHELMSLFGDKVHYNMFETNIKINTKDLNG